MTGDDRLLRLARSGDRAAARQLLEENSGLIWSVVRRYCGRGVDPDDLFQLGSIGFIKAVEGFDESFGTRFSTYAVPKIAGEIRRFLRDDGPVKVSRGLRERAMAIYAARSGARQSLGREPTVTELAEILGLTPEEVAEAETAASPADSLQRETGEGGFTLENVLSDDGQEDRLVENACLHMAIRTLSEKEQQVISLRFYHGLTQTECSRILGISQVQVSRLERRAVETLRQRME